MREPKVTIAFGMKGVGKTYTTKQVIRQYISGKSKLKAKPVIILDTQGEYSEAKAIYYNPDIEDQFKRTEQLRKIKKPYLYRILSRKPNGQIMVDDEIIQAVLDICLYFSNGLFVMEDINTYITSNLPKRFLSTLVSVRHRGIDLMIHYQRIGDPPPKIWGNANIIRLHKTIDSVSAPGTFKKAPNPEIIRLGEIIIDNEIKTDYNKAKTNKQRKLAKYTFLRIDIENNKFAGLDKKYLTNEVLAEYFLDETKREKQLRNTLIAKNVKNVDDGVLNELKELYF